jgi:hypothetical protein
MEKYIPLGLAIFLVIGGITIEHSIFNAGLHTTAQTRWMSYGLEGFVFILWALGMFVIGAIHKDFCQGDIFSGSRREIFSSSTLIELSK